MRHYSRFIGPLTGIALLATTAYTAIAHAADTSGGQTQEQSFNDQIQPYTTANIATSEVAWTQGAGGWQVIRHLKGTAKEYYSANSAQGAEYMSLSILFTPKKHCDDGKPFIAAKLSSPTPFSAKKEGKVTTQFDDFESRSFVTDYIFTEGSYTIWIDMPAEFQTGARHFHTLSVRTEDYLKGAPARKIPLSGSIEALQRAQNFCYQLLRLQ